MRPARAAAERSIVVPLSSNQIMKTMLHLGVLAFLLLAAPVCTFAGIEADIPLTNRVVLKSGAWTPTPEQPQKALSSIRPFLNLASKTNAQQRTEIQKILANMKNYRVQFIGVVRDGRKVMLCNFFPAPEAGGKDERPYWKRDQIMVDDGGFQYWQIYYDPNTDKCFDFASNGYA